MREEPIRSLLLLDANPEERRLISAIAGRAGWSVVGGTDEPDPLLTNAVAAAAHQAGVIVLTCGTYGNVLRFLPPLSISDELLNEGLDVVAAAFSEATA